MQEHQLGRLPAFDIIRSSRHKNRETLVLLHGNGLNRTTWAPLLPHLSDQYDIITFDLPGHGEEPASETPVTWDSLYGSFLTLMNRLGLSQVHLAGHGIGANLAVVIAGRYPPLVQSLILISVPGYIPSGVLEQTIRFRRNLLESNSLAALAEHMVRAITIHPPDSPESVLIRQAYESASAQAYIHMLDLFAGTDIVSDLSSIRHAALVLAGEKDNLFSPALSAITSSYIEGSRFLVVPDASNALFVDQPRWTANWMIEHIESSRQKSFPVQSEMTPTSSDIKETLHRIIDAGHKVVRFGDEMKVQLLGTFRVTINGVDMLDGWNTRQAKNLLVYLLLHPTVTRQQLYDALWPDTDLHKAQNNLRVCLSHLRQVLEQGHRRGQPFEFLHVDREHISLHGDIRCDLITLLETVRTALEEEDEAVKEACIAKLFDSLPRDLLSGYCDDWILGIREQLEANLASLSGWISQRLIRKGQHERAMKYSRYHDQGYEEDPPHAAAR